MYLIFMCSLFTLIVLLLHVMLVLVSQEVDAKAGLMCKNLIRGDCWVKENREQTGKAGIVNAKLSMCGRESEQWNGRNLEKFAV